MVIIWLNGAFGSGKTTLTEELHRRLPDAVICDPEDVGYVEISRQGRLNNIARCVAAAEEQPEDTLLLRSDLMDPSRLADAVLTAVGRR